MLGSEWGEKDRTHLCSKLDVAPLHELRRVDFRQVNRDLAVELLALLEALLRFAEDVEVVRHLADADVAQRCNEDVDEFLHADREDPLTPSLDLGMVDRVPETASFGEFEEAVHLARLAGVGRHAAAAEKVRLGALVAEEEERGGESADELVCNENGGQG